MDRFQSGDEGVIAFKSSNPFEFFHILNSKPSEEQHMFGSLIFPEQKKKNILLLYVCMEVWVGEGITMSIQ